jgi:hypothetical protein
MRKEIVGFILLLSAVLSYAQEKSSLFGYGISTDFFSVPLSEQSLALHPTNVYCSYLLNDDLNFKVGFDGLMIKDVNTKRFENLSGLVIGAGFTLLHDRSRNFTTELTLEASNGFAKFSTFSNYHADLGVRLMMFKSFYLGTGARFAHNEVASIAAAPLNSYNWFMQMGIQLYLQKR